MLNIAFYVNENIIIKYFQFDKRMTIESNYLTVR